VPRTKREEPKDALHGVPITIKDNLDTAGLVSSGGPKGPKGFVPEHEDLALTLPVLVGVDWRDPSVVPIVEEIRL
jgi:Amidase